MCQKPVLGKRSACLERARGRLWQAWPARLRTDTLTHSAQAHPEGRLLSPEGQLAPTTWAEGIQYSAGQTQDRWPGLSFLSRYSDKQPPLLGVKAVDTQRDRDLLLTPR